MKLWTGREIIPAVLAVLVFIHGATTSPYFLDFRYLLDRSSLYVETGLLALGMTLIIAGGQIDLSVSAILALVACIVAKALAIGMPIILALPLGIALGAGLGWLNGVLISRMKLPSFMVTLATMAAFRGAAQAMVPSESVRVPMSLMGVDMITIPHTPIPLPLLILIFMAVIVGLLLHRTTFGRRLAATGTNERASFFSGVDTPRITSSTFVWAGALSGLAGMIMSSRLGVARFDHGRGMEVDAITAVVLGGASIYGGSASIIGTMLALLLVGLIRTDMGIQNVTAEYQLAVIGALLVLSVLFNNGLGRLKMLVFRRPQISN